MAERTEQEIKLLHPDRKLVTPMDVLRGSDFKTGLIISGATVSNNLDILSGGGRFYQVSSEVKVRILNLELYNQEAGWAIVEFRDGLWTGGRVLGPYQLQGLSEKRLVQDELVGRYFTSAVVVVVLSGFAAQPLSNGIKVNMSIINEPGDWRE